MGRRQTWDTAEVLTSAMALFWQQGYARTPIREVEASTGLHPGSLYKKYGNKDGLFAAVVGHYNDNVVAERVARYLSGDDPLGGIREYFRSSFADGGAEPDPGCLLTNSAIESYSLEPACRDAVSDGLGRLESGFGQALARAQALGQLGADAAPEQLATQLLVLYQGTLVLVRLGMSAGKLDDVVHSAINAIVGVSEP